MSTPTFITADPATELSTILANYEALTGITPVNGTPEYAFCTCLAYHAILYLNRGNAAGLSLLISESSAPILDYLVAFFSMTRKAAQYATCTLRFTLIAGHQAVTIPAGTRVRSTDGEVTFSTDDDVTVAANNTSNNDTVTITATCSTSGTAGNNYAIGTITALQDVYAYIVSVENTDKTANGSDEETDSELKARAALAPSQYSVAGPRSAYIYWTKTADTLVFDAKPMTWSEDNTIPFGECDVYVLMKNSTLPTAAQCTAIQAYLTSNNILPQTDTVSVKIPTAVNYSLSIEIVLDGTVTATSITASLDAILTNFATSKSEYLGMNILASEIEVACKITGVEDVLVTIVPASGSLTSRNYLVTDKQQAVMTGHAISYKTLETE